MERFQQHRLETTSCPVPAATPQMLLMSLFRLVVGHREGKNEEEKAAPLSSCPDDHLMLDQVHANLKYYKV